MTLYDVSRLPLEVLNDDFLDTAVIVSIWKLNWQMFQLMCHSDCCNDKRARVAISCYCVFFCNVRDMYTNLTDLFMFGFKRLLVIWVQHTYFLVTSLKYLWS